MVCLAMCVTIFVTLWEVEETNTFGVTFHSSSDLPAFAEVDRV